MEMFPLLAVDAHEAVHFASDPHAGLRAIVAVHSTALGPAVGGTRLYPYATEADALRDVLQLSRDMTWKSAIHGLPFGGGKAVIVAGREQKTPELLTAYGRAIDRLGGTYIASEDVGISSADLELVGRVTPHVTLPASTPCTFADPAFSTAYGVLCGLKAAAREATSQDDLRGLVVAVQGVGAVGSRLARLLRAEGARLVVADVDPALAQRVAGSVGAEVSAADEILTVACDVLAPCALGGVIDAAIVARLRCRAIAGAANNQLSGEDAALALAQAGIAYAPDFVVNSGGMVHEGGARGGWDDERIRRQLEQIDATVTEVFARARMRGQTTAACARELALERLQQTARAFASGGRPDALLAEAEPAR